MHNVFVPSKKNYFFMKLYFWFIYIFLNKMTLSNFFKSFLPAAEVNSSGSN